MKRFFSLGRGSKPKELIPESRRLEEAPRKNGRKGKEMVQDVVKLGMGQQGVISSRVEAEVRSENDQEVYQYDMPTAELGFGDLLKEHNPGERMPGIAVSKKSSQPREAIMRDLEQMQPDVDRKPIKMPRKFVLPLQNQEEKIGLDQIFTKINPRMPYILIRKMSFILTPLSSFFDSFTNVNVMILDTRMLNRPKRQTAKLNSNVDYRGSLSLDYCFPASSLPKMFLYLQLEVQLMEMGEEWATVMMKVEAEEMDFPVMEEFQPVAIVAHLPPSGLSKYKFDPTHMDLTIRDIHRRKLLDLYESGDLADTTKPILNKTGKVKYASTSVQKTARGGLVDQTGEVDWSNIRGRAHQEVDEISEDPSQEFGVELDPEIQALKVQGLLQVREQERLKKIPVALVPEAEKEEDEESLMSFEKEAAENMKKNEEVVKEKEGRSAVGFLIGGVRE
jgi:hypothetical protein